MKQKLTAILTAISMIACSVPVVSLGAEPMNTIGKYHDIAWTIADGVLTLEGEGDVIYEEGFPDAEDAIKPNWGNTDTITKIVFGEGITYADAFAFSDYPALETVVLSEGFDTFSAGLFMNCPNLREIEGIERVENFNSRCLFGTAMMEENPFIIVDGELRYCDIAEPMEIVVPDGVTTICKDAFGNMMHYPHDFYTSESTDIESSLFTIKLPESVKRIERLAFSNLAALTSVNIPEGVTEIGAYAFFNCLRLQSVTLSENVAKIGDYAFLNCKELNEVTINCKNAQIGKDAFGKELDTERYLKEHHEATDEEIAEFFAEDPYLPDTILMGRINWFGDNNYIDAEDILVEETLDAYGDVSDSMLVHGYVNSTAHYYIHEMGLHFASIDKGTLALGDVNGDTFINAVDASVILVEAANRAAGGSTKLTAEQMSCADVNGDAAFNASDAAIVLQYAAFTATGGKGTLEEFVK